MNSHVYIITKNKAIENTAKYFSFQAIILDEECNDNTISNNDFKGNMGFSIMDFQHLTLGYKMNNNGYNYCESEFYFIEFVIIGAISIISVYKFL
ncbi:MAG: hypothetical protein ACFFAO_10905 [Candidatus Hermodarchaeota archaeon]